ncbi:hypothetical protein Tco_0618544 [Tanacetum coccineum]
MFLNITQIIARKSPWTFSDVMKMRYDDEEENVEDEEKTEDDEDMSDQSVHTPPDYQLSEESEKQEDDDVEMEKNMSNNKAHLRQIWSQSSSTHLQMKNASANQTEEDKEKEIRKETESTNDPTIRKQRQKFSKCIRSQPTDLDDYTHQEFNTGDDDVTPTREAQDERQWHPSSSPTPDPAGSQSSFDELMATHIDFSAFMINRLKINYLTQELLIGPTYDLMKGMPYPHDLSKPLPLILNARGRLVIPFDHFINNDLEYLKGGSLSHKESARDVYSKRRIIVVTKIEIVEWHNYKRLNWITIRKDDDKLYKFKEDDFNRLCIQDIKDMLLLLVQGKLTNLTVEERLAFNVSLRMFTRSIVIQRCVEDLQLGVESYQKKLNLTKPDTYRQDIKRRDAYTTYSNPRGFIY